MNFSSKPLHSELVNGLILICTFRSHNLSFISEAIDYFGSESTTLDQGEWLLRAATSNYIYIGLLISKAGEMEVDGDERIGEVFHSIKKCLAQMNKKDET